MNLLGGCFHIGIRCNEIHFCFLYFKLSQLKINRNCHSNSNWYSILFCRNKALQILYGIYCYSTQIWSIGDASNYFNVSYTAIFFYNKLNIHFSLDIGFFFHFRISNFFAISCCMARSPHDKLPFLD